MSKAVWRLAAAQHGVVTRPQLLRLGLRPDGIKHRVASGRLHPVRCGVYAVGRPEISRRGTWMAAVLSCGPLAALSHESAAALWEMRTEVGPIQISVRSGSHRRGPGLVIHRRNGLPATDVRQRYGIPVTSPQCTLLDLATRLASSQLEAAINEADKRDLIDVEDLRDSIDGFAGRPGVGVLRAILDRRTFALTDSELERRFLPLTRRAGLPQPETGRDVNGFKVDFYWPDLGLVVETDGLRYHRTPAQQARDRLRDQTHTAAGLTAIRFTHSQVRFEPQHVRDTLAAVRRRLSPRGSLART